MKQRFTLLDLRATLNELNERLSNTFIQNFYSTQQRFIFIKFSNKDSLLIEPGSRMHLSQSTDVEISHFCKKLREKCRHARVHRIYQYGFDRIAVIDIQRCKIVIEFFSAGNILILDENSMILELLRPVENLGIVRGKKYIFNPIDLELTYERFKTCEGDLSEMLPFEKEYVDMVKSQLEKELDGDESKEQVDAFFKRVRDGLDTLGGFGEVTIEKNKPSQLFSFKTVEPAVEIRGSQARVASPELRPEATDATDVQVAAEALKSLKVAPRYPIALRDKEEVDTLVTKAKARAVHFPSFNEAAEYYFYESQKRKKKVKEGKGERIRKAQERYIDELETQAECLKETGEILDENQDFVRGILDIFRKVYENRMEWGMFEAFWEEEKRRGNPQANAIASFDLSSKKCIILLEDRHIELDLSISLSKNIENYFNRRRKAVDKSEKTKTALDNIVEKFEPKKAVVPAQKREPYWFEKFNFFISSANELVIGGKNAQQNEIIVKKYLEANDLYFHGEVQGASSVICKGRTEVTIEEAAYMALCMSKCWSEGVIRSVFYVEGEQVSKSAPSGEFLTKGSFMIKGKKHMVNPYRLEYGTGILFKLEGATSVTDFVSDPPEGSRILHAMPVAAPWICVKAYKYKVRLCPAGDKKSKLCQDIKAGFDALSEGSPEEKFVKAVGLDEYMGVVPGKSKISKPLK